MYEILNAMLFLIIGFELLLIPGIRQYWLIGCLIILIVLVSRYLSLWLPARLIPHIGRVEARSMTFLVWGEFRGGVSVALAITLDDHLTQNLFMAATCYVAVFSIFVQGLSIGWLASKVKPGKSL